MRARMNVQRVFVPTCLLLVLLFTVVPRGMDTTRYYEVSGTSAKELRES